MGFRCNIMFSKTIREPHKKKRIEIKNVQNVAIKKEWTDDNHLIRAEIMEHAPDETWSLGGIVKLDDF